MALHCRLAQYELVIGDQNQRPKTSEIKDAQCQIKADAAGGQRPKANTNGGHQSPKEAKPNVDG